MSTDTSISLLKLGRYVLKGTATEVRCMKFEYDGQPTVIGECGEIFTHAYVQPLQVWCDGWSKDHSNTDPPSTVQHTFTMDECTKVTPPLFKCKASSVKLDTHTGTVFGVLDNGRQHTADWTPTGLERGSGMDHDPFKDVVIQKTNVKVKSGSTPVRVPEVAQHAPSQKYQAPPAGWTPGGDVRSDPFRWFAPSMPSTPTVDRAWTLERWVSYDAKFESPNVIITNMDLTTGIVAAHPGTPTWNEQGECKSAPLKVTVNRARQVR